MANWSLEYDPVKEILHPFPYAPIMNGVRPIVLLDVAKGITLNGADVSNLADQSGNGNDVSQGTAVDQPLFNASDSNFNNNPSITLDGVSEFLRSAAFASPLVQPNTIFVVYKYADLVGSQFLIDGITGGRNVFFTSGAQGIMFAGAIQNIHTEDTSTHILAGLFDAASSDSWHDGTQSTPGGSPGVADLDGITLGLADNNTGFFAGEIAYVLVYNSNLSDAAKNYIGNGLAARFGTTWTNIS